MANCGTCKFWDTSASLVSDDATAQCRRAPPFWDERTGAAVWPFTEETDWCGEHQPDEPTDAVPTSLQLVES